jgi:alkylation response protein AidB-like acyl-CoA dehydrogenase
VGIAISEAHQELEAIANDLLRSAGARAANRALLEAPSEGLPSFWGQLVEVGWLGLHLPEALGGSGYGLPELVVVAEAMGRAVAPGPFVPTVIASAVLAACGSEEQRHRWVPGLADGSLIGAFGFGDDLVVGEGSASGSGGVVLGGGLAQVLLVVAGDDVVVVQRDGDGVKVEEPANIDHSRRSVLLTLDDASVEILVGAARLASALARTILAAEAAGGARECCEMATSYAKVREQFGRVIGTFQAVKHHCANMLVATELATAAVWDAASVAAGDLDQFEVASAVAASLAAPAFLDNSHLNTQVHGGIGYTWEHDAHLLMRRALAIASVVEGHDPGSQIIASSRAGVTRTIEVELPEEAQALRVDIRAFAEEAASLDDDAALERLVETGYVMPHWPKPWGREASPVEQLVIEEEFRRAGVFRPEYGIAAWVVLTLVQHGSADQVERWVLPALRREQVWCQLFSEPEAGSDAAGIKTRGSRVEGGWIVNGQKVWTSGADSSHLGLATVRTDSTAPKHAGVTTMVIDMHAAGVEVRPLRQVDGKAEFSEVFLTDVFVPDDDVVGPVDAGWTVARATLGNERVSIGGMPGLGIQFDPVALMDANPTRAAGAAREVAKLLATDVAGRLLNVRRVARAVAGAGPGPEGNLTKLVQSEISYAQGVVGLRLVGAAAAFTDGMGRAPALINLRTRAMSIAGGTSEITRNQIGERLLGLPRDPLLR